MGGIPASDWSLINATADGFERAWKEESRPRIEDYLAKADESRRPWLLEELLRVEWELRQEGGERPTAEEYLRRFPQHRDAVAAVLDGSPAASEVSVGAGPSPPQMDSSPRDRRAMPSLPLELADHPEYRVVRELGRGGMGVVYLAHNRLMARDEVLKVMGRHIVEQPGVMDRFLHEIRAVARLRHPNIVSAYTAFRCGDDLVLAMEYVAGLNLAQVVQAKGAIAVRQACSYVHQAALGLQYAHEEGMVHRDIKPANLMLSHQRDRALIKLLDFGLSKAASEQNAGELGILMAIDSYDFGTHLTCTGDMLGTPDFIAPEQIAASRQADIRADIYSLGCTLYYLLSGRVPFPNLTLREVLKAHRSLDARPLDQVRAEVPADLSAIVARMMAKEPGRRFQTPSQVAAELVPFFKKPAVAPRSSPAAAGATRPASEAVAAPIAKTGAGMQPSLIAIKQPEDEEDAADIGVKPARRQARWLWPAAAGVLLLALIVARQSGVFKARSGDNERPVAPVPKTPAAVPRAPAKEVPSPSPSAPPPMALAPTAGVPTAAQETPPVVTAPAPEVRKTPAPTPPMVTETPGDAAKAADDLSPEKILEGRGLKRSGMLYVVDTEADFIPQVTKLQPAYRQLKAAYDKLASVMLNQAEYDQLNDEWTLVNERLRNVQAQIDTHPPLNNNELRQNWNNLLEEERQLRFRYNELGREVNLRYRRLVSDAEKERLQDEFQKQREAFVDKSKELRSQSEKIKAEYDELAHDDAVKKALEALKGSTKARITLGPSPGFKNASTWLTNALKNTSPDSIKPARNGSRNPRQSKGAIRGGGTSPTKERPAKGATKGTRAKSATSDEPEDRPH